jgi:hypothetical protein
MAMHIAQESAGSTYMSPWLQQRMEEANILQCDCFIKMHLYCMCAVVTADQDINALTLNDCSLNVT